MERVWRTARTSRFLTATHRILAARAAALLDEPAAVQRTLRLCACVFRISLAAVTLASGLAVWVVTAGRRRGCCCSSPVLLDGCKSFGLGHRHGCLLPVRSSCPLGLVSGWAARAARRRSGRRDEGAPYACGTLLMDLALSSSRDPSRRNMLGRR